MANNLLVQITVEIELSDFFLNFVFFPFSLTAHHCLQHASHANHTCQGLVVGSS